MDVRSIPRLNDQEAHRALELLEELFQALLDIQEFYEITLLDESKSIQQKTAETLQIACKWENSPPLSGLSYLSDHEANQYCQSNNTFCADFISLSLNSLRSLVPMKDEFLRNSLYIQWCIYHLSGSSRLLEAELQNDRT
ncbi:disks large 1 tumor suppressor protein [Caerostris extrusa]|uniref:Disks large 1 tumor suppressor protein n=1 Tax=Caerostris extrusa TaxID=172846 RepID=A0AAV4MGQ8_CAEEX|nr:disks large 1 tumor suppressor protein [Caerostris extrusa]